MNIINLTFPGLTAQRNAPPATPTEDAIDSFDETLSQFDGSVADAPQGETAAQTQSADVTPEDAAEQPAPTDEQDVSPTADDDSSEVDVTESVEAVLPDADKDRGDGAVKIGVSAEFTVATDARATRFVIGDGRALVTGSGKAEALLEAVQGIAQPGAPPDAAAERAGNGPQPQLEQQQPLDANVARVTRGLQSALQQNGGTVTLRLHPPELGVVRIEVEIQNNTVTARFQTETESVRQLLMHQIRSLRSTLEGQGLVVDRLHVQTQQATSSTSEQSLREETADGRSRGRHDQTSQQDAESREGQPRRRSFMEALVNLVG